MTLTGRVFDISKGCVHDGPGLRTVVFLKGCSLGCPWCHNLEGTSRAPQIGHAAAECIRCGRCLDACPLGLEPDQVSIRVEAGRPLDTEPHGPLDCYECGCCSYVCPSGRPLVQFMQVAKGALRRAAETRAS